ncbi:tyrosine protein phosphatase 1 [Elasticomyces elasticus]|nr:tyrosine protein phosphatase 1 [Elasticomyces elasticus]
MPTRLTHSSRNVKGRGWHKKGYRERGYLYIQLKRSYAGFSRTHDVNEYSSITEFIHDLMGEDYVLRDGDALHYEFYAKRQLLVPSDARVNTILDGGETVYAKIIAMEIAPAKSGTLFRLRRWARKHFSRHANKSSQQEHHQLVQDERVGSLKMSERTGSKESMRLDGDKTPSTPTSRTLSTFKILSLPAELLLDITELLDASDAACLALVNRSLYKQLGKRFVRDGWQISAQRKSFLLRLALDWPAFFYCYNCQHLHRISDVRIYQPFWCDPGQRYGHDGANAPYRITFHDTQLAMMRHHQRPAYGLPLSAFSTKQVHITDSPKSTSLFSIDAQIIDDELYLRIEEWAMFKGSVPVHQSTETEFAECALGITWLSACEHFGGTSWLPYLIICNSQHAEHPNRFCLLCEDRLDCRGLLECSTCNTEFEVDIRHLGRDISAVVLTKWCCLGSGLIASGPPWLYNRLQYSYVRRARRTDGVHALFEQHAERSYAQLSVDNAQLYHERRSRWLALKGCSS